MVDLGGPVFRTQGEAALRLVLNMKHQAHAIDQPPTRAVSAGLHRAGQGFSAVELRHWLRLQTKRTLSRLLCMTERVAKRRQPSRLGLRCSSLRRYSTFLALRGPFIGALLQRSPPPQPLTRRNTCKTT